jgi:hypothetical protein
MEFTHDIEEGYLKIYITIRDSKVLVSGGVSRDA